MTAIVGDQNGANGGIDWKCIVQDLEFSMLDLACICRSTLEFLDIGFENPRL